MEHRDTELYFLREQSSQSKSLALWSLPSLYIYFSVPLIFRNSFLIDYNN